MPQLPDAPKEWSVRVADRSQARQLVQGCVPAAFGQLAPCGMPAQCLKHLDVEDVRHVHRLVRVLSPEPLTDLRRHRLETEVHRDRRRRVDNDQGLTEIAGIAGVPEPADGRVRRPVQFDRLVPAYTL
jgi:hypothetical protein